MSKPRYDWWPYVKGMIRRYPSLKEEVKDLHTPMMIANYTGERGGTEAARTSEDIAIRELPRTHQREYEAVRRAVETTKGYKTGKQRIRLIDLVYWDKSHTITGAANMIKYSEDVSKRWHGEFIRLVASYYGLLD